MTIITVRPQTVLRGAVEIAVAVSSAAAPGTALLNSSARPTATGSTPATGTMALASASGGRLPLETSLYPLDGARNLVAPSSRGVVPWPRVRIGKAI